MSDTGKFLNLPVEILTAIIEDLEDVERHCLRLSCRSLHEFISPSDELHISGPGSQHTTELYDEEKADLSIFLKKIVLRPWLAKKIVYVIDQR